MPLGASEPSLPCYLALIKTIEGEHAGVLDPNGVSYQIAFVR